MLIIIKDVVPTCCNHTWLWCSRVKKNKVETGPCPLLNNCLICSKTKNPEYKDDLETSRLIYSFCTVKDLKANVIYLQALLNSLKDVNFRSHFFSAMLELHEWYVSMHTKPFFMNFVAYELSPNSPTDGKMASYISLMKSLIDRSEDVNESWEKKILYICLFAIAIACHYNYFIYNLFITKGKKYQSL